MPSLTLYHCVQNEYISIDGLDCQMPGVRPGSTAGQGTPTLDKMDKEFLDDLSLLFVQEIWLLPVDFFHLLNYLGVGVLVQLYLGPESG